MEPQKKSLKASERDETQRQAFGERQAEVALERLVVLDECGSRINLTPLYGYAPRGQRLVQSVPRNYGQNVSLVCGMSANGILAPLVFEGALDTALFEAYVEQVLVPELVAGQIVVLDNLAVHKSAKARQLIESKDCELWFLPTYSPDLAPIELAFAQIKQYLKQVGARTRSALEQAIGEGLERVLPHHAQAYFKHCGYLPLAQ